MKNKILLKKYVLVGTSILMIGGLSPSVGYAFEDRSVTTVPSESVAVEDENEVVELNINNVKVTVLGGGVPLAETEKFATAIVNQELGTRAVITEGSGTLVGTAQTKYWNVPDFPHVKNGLISACSAASGAGVLALGGGVGGTVAAAGVSGYAASKVLTGIEQFGMEKTLTATYKIYSDYYDRYVYRYYHTVYKGNTNTPLEVYLSDVFF